MLTKKQTTKAYVRIVVHRRRGLKVDWTRQFGGALNAGRNTLPGRLGRGQGPCGN